MTRSSVGTERESDDSTSRRRSTTPGQRAVRTSRRRLLGAAATGALGTAVAGCLEGATAGSDAADELRVGVMYGGTGDAQTTAAEVAAAEINDDGGLLGREVTVVTAETNKSPSEARRNYHRLILEDDVDVTMGLSTTSVLEYLIGDFAEQETLHFTTGSGTLTPPERIKSEYERFKYHFRTGPLNNAKLIENQLAFVRDLFPRRGWDSVAILTEGYPWTERIIPTFERYLPQFGIDVSYSHRYRPSRDGFGPIYDQIEASGADVVWVGMGHTGARAVSQWARERRPFEFGGTHIGLQSLDYYALLRGAPRYTFTQTAATPTSELTPHTQAFAERYRAETDGEEPIYTSYHMYDSFRAYRAAVEAAGTLETDAVIGALEELEIEGTTGKIAYYGEDGEYPHDRVYDPTDEDFSGSVFFQWQEDESGEGVQHVIWPDEHTTAEYTSPPWI